MKARRAKRGSIGSVMSLRLTRGMRERLTVAATRKGVSVAEWIRQAVEPLLSKPLQ